MTKRPRAVPLGRLLAERGHYTSVDEAARHVMAGEVFVDGQRVDKPGTSVRETAEIMLRGQARYAGRGGYKLEAALDYFGVDVAGRVALDCGASTGGFTDCLLRRGATLVYAVEAGYGQLVGRLRQDARVRNMERTNLGHLTRETLTPLPAFITLDLSYLSLADALPQVTPLLAPEGEVVALFKPLFEVNDSDARRVGQIADPSLIVDALARVLRRAEACDLTTVGVVKLALRPRHGEQEYFLHLARQADNTHVIDRGALGDIVASAGIGPTHSERP